jgi:predicted amidohydrolase YtcJ
MPIAPRRRRLAVFVLVALVALVASASSTAEVRSYSNGRWWNGEAFVAGDRFVVDGVLRSSWDGEAAETVDLAGGFVVPPLADAHSHGLADPGAAKEERAFLAAGILYVGNPNNLGSWVDAARAAVAAEPGVEVLYANGGLTSPGGHPAQIYAQLVPRLGREPSAMNGDAYWEIADAAALERLWPKILADRPDFLKVYLERSEEHARRQGAEFSGQRGLDPALVRPVVERAHAAGLRVLAHVTTAADFRAAVDAGVDQVAHLPLEPIAAVDAAAARDAGVATVTTWLSHRPKTGFAAPDEAMAANLRALGDAGATVLLGTDSHFTVVDEMLALERTGVLDRLALLGLATGTTPRWLFPDRRLGCLADGCEASFLVLDADPTADLAALRAIRLRVLRGAALP